MVALVKNVLLPIIATLRGFAFGVLAIGCVMPSPTIAQSPIPSSETTTLQALAFGFLANRQKLSEFVWEFSVTVGEAASVEDARELRIEEKHTLQGIWAVRDNVVRYEYICPSIELEQPKKSDVLTPGTWAAVECGSKRILYDGTTMLRDSLALQTANISPDFTLEAVLNFTPFSIGLMGGNEKFSPGNSILAALSRGSGVKYIGTETRQGRLVDVVTHDCHFEGAVPNVICHRWYLDREQGYYPIEGEYIGNEVGQVAAMAVAKEMAVTEDGCFYPRVGVAIDFLDKPPPHRVHVFRSLSLKTERPSDEEMTLKLAAGTVVVDTRDMRRALRLREPRSISGSDLPNLLEECYVKAEERGDVEPRKVQHSNTALQFLSITGGLLVLMFVWLLWRRG